MAIARHNAQICRVGFAVCEHNLRVCGHGKLIYVNKTGFKVKNEHYVNTTYLYSCYLCNVKRKKAEARQSVGRVEVRNIAI